MNGKERLNNVLRKRLGSAICWSTMIDNKTTAEWPE